MCDKIKDGVDEALANCINFLREYAQNLDSDYKAVIEAEDSEIPCLIGRSDIADRCIEERLLGKPVDDSSTVHEVISGCDFDYEDEHDIAVNDGKLFVLARLFRIFGDEKSEQEARDWVYRD